MQCKGQWEDQQVDPPVCDECGEPGPRDREGFCLDCADVVARDRRQVEGEKALRLLEEILTRGEPLDIPEYVRDLARQCWQESVRGVQR